MRHPLSTWRQGLEESAQALGQGTEECRRTGLSMSETDAAPADLIQQQILALILDLHRRFDAFQGQVDSLQTEVERMQKYLFDVRGVDLAHRLMHPFQTWDHGSSPHELLHTSALAAQRMGNTMPQVRLGETVLGHETVAVDTGRMEELMQPVILSGGSRPAPEPETSRGQTATTEEAEEAEQARTAASPSDKPRYSSLEDGPQYSLGSELHPNCKPCAFFCFSRKGCKKEASCGFCHGMHVSRTKKGQAANRAQQRPPAPRRSSRGAQVDQAGPISGGMASRSDDGRQAVLTGSTAPMPPRLPNFAPPLSAPRSGASEVLE